MTGVPFDVLPTKPRWVAEDAARDEQERQTPADDYEFAEKVSHALLVARDRVIAMGVIRTNGGPLFDPELMDAFLVTEAGERRFEDWL